MRYDCIGLMVALIKCAYPNIISFLSPNDPAVFMLRRSGLVIPCDCKILVCTISFKLLNKSGALLGVIGEMVGSFSLLSEKLRNNLPALFVELYLSSKFLYISSLSSTPGTPLFNDINIDGV